MKFNQRTAFFAAIIISIFVNIINSAPTTPSSTKSANKSVSKVKDQNTTPTTSDVKTFTKSSANAKAKNKDNVAKIDTSSKTKVTLTSSTKVKSLTTVTVKPTTPANKVQKTEQTKETTSTTKNVPKDIKDKILKINKNDISSSTKKLPEEQTTAATLSKPDVKKDNTKTENNDNTVSTKKTDIEKFVKNVTPQKNVEQTTKPALNVELKKKVEKNPSTREMGDENKKTNSKSEKDTISKNDPKTNTNVLEEKSKTKPISNKNVPSTTEKQTNTDVAKQAKVESKTEKLSKERLNNVRRNMATTTTTTTQATVTDTVTTWNGLPCNNRFRAHPTDKTKYEVAFADNVFESLYQMCPGGLEWRQDQCQCGWPEPVFTENCSCCGEGLKAHSTDTTMYLRLVNGLWLEEACSTYDNNQLWDDEKCSCVWDPNKPQSHKAPTFKGATLPRLMTKCMNLVNMTLDEGLKDDKGRDLTPLYGRQRIRVVDETGNIGKSVEIRRAPFKLGIFNGNDLQSTVYVKFNFKVHKDKVRMRKKMVIMSNGCRRRWQRKTILPSLEVAFFPYNETFEVRFSTTGKTVVEYMKGTKDDNGWYNCVLYLQDRVLNLKVNGQKVYSTNGMSGGVKTTDCPLTVAGSPTNAKNHFDGYLDEFQIVKQCKYEPDSGS